MGRGFKFILSGMVGLDSIYHPRGDSYDHVSEYLMSKIKVLVNGYQGRMGVEAIKAIDADPALDLVGKTGRGDDLSAQIQASGAQVVVDLTVASAVFANVNTIMDAGARVVVGTSGLLPEQLAHLEKRAQAEKLGIIVAPNFSLGAVLMMKAAQEIARRFEHAEIIEMHHHQKQDAPSGTAMKTADMIAHTLGTEAAHTGLPDTPPTQEILPGARGATQQESPIPAVR
jgi:4-hydroxy-tetrahydrodipicolinate reductase